MLIQSLLFQIYLHEPVHTHRAETWGQGAQSCSAQPVVNMTIGERIAPTIVTVTIATVIHMLPTCVGHPPKPSPTPSPQPVICVYCGSSDHRLMECRNRPQDNREEGRIPSPASSGYSRDKQCKLATASSDSSQKSNVRFRNSVKLQRPETGRQQQQQPQRPTQGKQNNNQSFPYRDYRYSDQPRQTRFNEKENQMYSPYHFAPFPCTLCRL